MYRQKYFEKDEVDQLNEVIVVNEQSFYLLRKFFFDTLTKEELMQLQVFTSKMDEGLLERAFIGSISAENPVGQHRDIIQDMLQIDGLPEDQIDIQLDARNIMQDFFKERLNGLKDGTQPTIKLNDLLDDWEQIGSRAACVKARGLIASYVDNLYVMVKRIKEGGANLTTEEIMKRQAKNSAK